MTIKLDEPLAELAYYVRRVVVRKVDRDGGRRGERIERDIRIQKMRLADDGETLILELEDRYE